MYSLLIISWKISSLSLFMIQVIFGRKKHTLVHQVSIPIRFRGEVNLIFQFQSLEVQCNLDLVTLNLVTTYDLVTILQRLFFNSLHKIIRFSDIM